MCVTTRALYCGAPFAFHWSMNPGDSAGRRRVIRRVGQIYSHPLGIDQLKCPNIPRLRQLNVGGCPGHRDPEGFVRDFHRSGIHVTRVLALTMRYPNRDINPIIPDFVMLIIGFLYRIPNGCLIFSNMKLKSP